MLTAANKKRKNNNADITHHHTWMSIWCCKAWLESRYYFW